MSVDPSFRFHAKEKLEDDSGKNSKIDPILEGGRNVLGKMRNAFQRDSNSAKSTEKSLSTDDGFIKSVYKKINPFRQDKEEDSGSRKVDSKTRTPRKKEEDLASKKDSKAATRPNFPSFSGTKKSNQEQDVLIRSDSTNPMAAIQNFFSRKERWVTVLPKTRLSPGEAVPVTVEDTDLLVVASKDGRKIYCVKNSCPHLGTPLELGQLVRLPNPSADSTPPSSPGSSSPSQWTEIEVAGILQQDGCEDCIVCPLHRTAFALESGQVRGEWCPYPPLLGKIMGTVKEPSPVEVYPLRIRGKNIQVDIMANA